MPRYSLTRTFLLTALTVAVALPVPGQAKPFSRVIADMGIPATDFSLMEEAARQLYADNAAAVGRLKKWSNAKTGSTGQVTVTQVRSGCVALDHLVQLTSQPDPIGLNTWRCRNAAGEWLLQLQPPD